MGTWPKIVESFPLTVSQVFQQYTVMPSDALDVFYHYTTHAGLEGILGSGGFQATYRMRMNDAGEFDYARNVIYKALNEVGRRRDLPNVAQSLATYTRKNLDKFLDDTTELSSAYCACLTISSDHPEQWETYAKFGTGFAIGFNLSLLLKMQVPAVQRGEPFIFCAPVTYNQRDQCDLVWRLVKAGICDLKTFAATCSQQSEHLTALRDRITREIVVHLLTLIDFIKAPTYDSEREIRLILDPNDGILKASNIQYYGRDNESIPFIFMDLRNPMTRRLPLVEIKVGPRASFSAEKAFLEGLLNELGYGSTCGDCPRITQSALKSRN
ncbi:MAG: hypothetical protein C3F12_00540 [Candidatus Methylomirabilota bacterium]|nr:DUF2971 domain-containing protein [candidate division NC10 bacterium]PWB49022.1 MAG: hypothetical protein C3F12_00540 [candidate division NC10 bacterium]